MSTCLGIGVIPYTVDDSALFGSAREGDILQKKLRDQVVSFHNAMKICQALRIVLSLRPFSFQVVPQVTCAVRMGRRVVAKETK